MRQWNVKTESGSTYRIIEAPEGDFRCDPDHVVNPRVRDLNGKTLEISRPNPWPAAVGEPLAFFYRRECGGVTVRRTSPVIRVLGPLETI